MIQSKLTKGGGKGGAAATGIQSDTTETNLTFIIVKWRWFAKKQCILQARDNSLN